MPRTIHLCLNIKGALRTGAWRRELVGSCHDQESGRQLTADEIFDELTQAIADGKRVLPMGPCDNFDYQRGCLGHER